MTRKLLTAYAFVLSSVIYANIATAADEVNIEPGTATVTYSGSVYKPGPDTFLLTGGQATATTPYVFNDAVKALEAINRSNVTNITLLITPGVYWLDDPDDPVIRRNSQNSGAVPFASEFSCDTLSIIGLTDNPSDVVFAVNRGQTQGALGNYTMLHFKGRSLTVKNMTFGNYCNVDLDYPRDPSLNRQKRRDAIVQAQLGICENTDRLFALNCRFISRLNLCPLVGARRSLYKDCYFECTDDALTGSAVYLDCRFTFFSGKPFYSTASTGAVFLNCDIHTLVNGTQYLTKMPGMVTMIDTRWTSDSPVTLQWTRDPSPMRCYQSNVTLNGHQVTIDTDRPELSAEISNSPLLKAYKVTDGANALYNIPNLLGGDDGWDPLGMRPQLKEIEKKLSTTLIGLPVAMRIIPSAKKLAAQGDSIDLTPSLILWGDYPAPGNVRDLTWNAPTALRLTNSDDRIIAISQNNFPRDIDCTVSASSSGLIGATTVTVGAYLKQAPGFTVTPSISKDKNNLRLNYELTGDERDDSYIVWYRSTRPDHSDSIAVRHGRGLSARLYPLTVADEGFYISASVTPKRADTRQGTALMTTLPETVTTKLFGLLPNNEKSLITSFAEIPIRKGTAGRQGFWNFDTFKPADTRQHDWTPDENKSWYYGRGADAATGTGLVQATRGARLSYTPVRKNCRNMRLSLIAEPCKGLGQGFGSATGQYMDICIKFDPISLTGYALRIERTPDFDKAVTFTLVRYENGTVSPVSESVASNCYRNPCTIVLEMQGNRLTALARTEAKPAEVTDSAIKPSVSLSAIVPPTDGTSLAIQHTGSVGASATLIRDLDVNWK